MNRLEYISNASLASDTGQSVRAFPRDQVWRIARSLPFRTPESPSSITSGSVIVRTAGSVLEPIVPHWGISSQITTRDKPIDLPERKVVEFFKFSDVLNQQPFADVIRVPEGWEASRYVVIEAKTNVFEEEPTFGQIGQSQYDLLRERIAKGVLSGPELVGFFQTPAMSPVAADRIKSQISLLFTTAAEIAFEDGIENDFSRQLELLVTTHGEPALVAIQERISNAQTNDSVVSEALRCLGRIDHAVTSPVRRAILEEALLHPSFCARNGAIFGLAAMDDPRAISEAIRAESKEKDPYLRMLLAKLVAQLRKSVHVPPPATSPT